MEYQAGIAQQIVSKAAFGQRIREDGLDARGAPVHRLGVTDLPGLYVLGLPFLSRRASSFIFGVEQDAVRLADHINART